MQLGHALFEELRVAPGERPHLDVRSTEGAEFVGDKAADRDLKGLAAELERAQELLYSTDSRALLVVLQGLDAAGKDGTIKHVMSGVNPQGCMVTSFKEPSAEELAHDFLWRSAIQLPPRGHIGLFNRSYYEDVVVVRVHPDRLFSPGGKSGKGVSPSFWRHRHDDINAYEKHLDRNGTRVVKFFLHLSKDEQRRRLLDRLSNPTKHWKFSPSDLAERQYWSDYQAVYEEVLTATSTKRAPWFVIPADDKHVARALVAWIIVRCIDAMALAPKVLTPEDDAAIEAAKAELLAESRLMPEGANTTPGNS
jgi:PPK2 family polyphosphate:nucleotide phosphotransferase